MGKKLSSGTVWAIFRKKILLLYLMFFLQVFGAVFSGSDLYSATGKKKLILHIDSYSPGYLWSEALRDGIMENLSFFSTDYDLSIEYMDTKINDPEKIFPRLAKIYSIKYASRQPDVIISSDNNALSFLERYRDRIFPGVPVVFCGINDYSDEIIKRFANSTGVAEAASFYDTMKLALDIFPQTETVYTLAGSTRTTQIHIREFYSIAGRFKNRVRFRGIHGLNREEFRQALKKIGPRSLIIYLGYYRDREGAPVSVSDSLMFIKEHTDTPVFTMWTQNLPFCLGGVMISGEEQGRQASKMALKVLAGTSASSIPVIKKSPNLPMFNYDELEHFRIDSAKLPENSVIINRPAPSFYARYKIQIWAVFVVMIILTVLSISLMITIALKRNALRDLENARSYIEDIIDSMPSAVIGVNSILRISQWNRAAGVITGVSLEDAMSRPLDEVVPELGGDIPKIVEALEKRETFIGLQRQVKKESETRYEDIKIFPLLENGEKGAVIMLDDVTERVRLEEMKIQSEQLRDQLLQSQKMESIGRLAGGVAHDLNNLLVPVIGYAEMIMQWPDLTDIKKRKVEQIYKAGIRAKELIAQLLAFSRKQTLSFEKVDLNIVIRDFYDLLRRTIRENVEINIDYSDGPLPVAADVRQLEQVLMNMAVNAADAMPDGGQLAIRTYSGTLPESESDGKEHAFLSISDTGKGMDESVLLHIFEPFFSTKGDGGTGLGLATAYGIVRQHNGNISVESEPGKGTVFNVSFPLSRFDGFEKREAAADVTMPAGAETVLVVEDNADVLELVELVLEKCGYVVLTATNGREALEIIKTYNNKIDLLVTDIVMPEMNGKELYSLARMDNRSLRVLFMSGYNDNIISHSPDGDIITSFIQKPFSPADLTQKVRDVLEGPPESLEEPA